MVAILVLVVDQSVNNHSAIENDFQINNLIGKTRLSVPFCAILA